MDNALEVKGLYKSFKKNFWSPRSLVLKGLSFSVPPSSAMGFLGANGSGKTTAFKCLLELIKKDSGEVKFFGGPLSPQIRSRIGFLPERPQFCEDLTGEECLIFYGSLSSIQPSALKQGITKGLKQLGLDKWRHKRLRAFSKGMLQKIGILQALLHEPDLLLLDEPFSGLDPESRFMAMELIRQRVKEGCSLLLSSHIFEDIERVCSRLLILKDGADVFEGNIADFQQFKTVRQSISYLLKGEKKILLTSSQEESQKELKRLLSEGAVILSLQSAGGSLEQKYKDLMRAKKP